jgi:hypothetical protein
VVAGAKTLPTADHLLARRVRTLELNTPRRFEIRFTTIEGNESEYSVVSWFGREKAIAWAAGIHSAQHPDRSIHRV